MVTSISIALHHQSESTYKHMAQARGRLGVLGTAIIYAQRRHTTKQRIIGPPASNLGGVELLTKTSSTTSHTPF